MKTEVIWNMTPYRLEHRHCSREAILTTEATIFTLMSTSVEESKWCYVYILEESCHSALYSGDS
jgi:hypothetical protein